MFGGRSQLEDDHTIGMRDRANAIAEKVPGRNICFAEEQFHGGTDALFLCVA